MHPHVDAAADFPVPATSLAILYPNPNPNPNPNHNPNPNPNPNPKPNPILYPKLEKTIGPPPSMAMTNWSDPPTKPWTWG